MGLVLIVLLYCTVVITFRCHLVGCMYCPRVTQSTPEVLKSVCVCVCVCVCVWGGGGYKFVLGVPQSPPQCPVILYPNTESIPLSPFPYTCKCLQHLLVCFPTPKHDGALGDHPRNRLLRLLQNRKTLLIACTWVTHQPRVGGPPFLEVQKSLI